MLEKVKKFGQKVVGDLLGCAVSIIILIWFTLYDIVVPAKLKKSIVCSINK